MRASRLVSIVLPLQARGRLTAAELAGILEVSVRTIYRDPACRPPPRSWTWAPRRRPPN